MLSEVERFDLRQGPVSDGWEKFLRKVRARPISRITKCTACRLRGLCGMCPATAQLENGDPEEPVDYLCQVAHLRALAVGDPDPVPRPTPSPRTVTANIARAARATRSWWPGRRACVRAGQSDPALHPTLAGPGRGASPPVQLRQRTFLRSPE